MSIKRKFITFALLMLVIPIVILVITGALFLTWFFLKDPLHLAHMVREQGFFDSGVLLNPRFQKGIIVWALVSAMLVVFSNLTLALLQTSTLLKPLQDLKLSIDRMKAGDLDFEVLTSSYEEVNEVCNAFEGMRKRLKVMKQSQDEYEKERAMMIANVSHDLRTPITSIKGYVEGIMDGIANTREKQDEYLKTIYIKAEVLEELVESMKEYSSYELKQARYDFRYGDIVPLLSGFLADCRLDLASEGIDLRISLPDKELIVMFDYAKLQRVFTNVVGNAVKYKKSTSSVLEVALEEWDNGICIIFNDDGKGIKSEDIQKVFEGHFRGDRARNSNIEGSGLGLSISKQIVEAHKGKIWAKSEEGVGTTIYIYLPLKQSHP